MNVLRWTGAVAILVVVHQSIDLSRVDVGTTARLAAQNRVDFQREVRHVIANGTRWAAPTRSFAFTYGDGRATHIKEPLEALG